jgi:hypothetical protein
MPLARWQATIVDEAGNIQTAASIEVRGETPGSPLASIFSDRDGVTPLGNPFSSDAEGFAAFHVVGGAYRITATKGAFSRIWRYVGIGTAQEADATEGEGEGQVTGPDGGVVAGQFAIFGDTSGSVIEGAEDGSSPPGPVTISDILDASALPDAAEAQRGVVEMATSAEIRAAATGAKAIMAEDLETASAGVALSDAATVAVDWDAGINFTLTVTANRAIGNPTNGQPGTWRTITVQGNDATDRTITFGNQFLGDVPVITDCDSTRWYDLYIRCHSATHFSVSSKKVNGT